MHDVIIIGGGPAGSALGSYLSMAGIKNVILERANHPRPHVGESMVVSSTRVFDEIGFLPTMEAEGFVHKYGASWHEIRGREAAIHFGEFPQEGIRQEYTYHVDRARFDLLMLKHAEQLGSEVYQGVQVKSVRFDGDRACGVRAAVAGQELDLEGRIIVDASGRGTVLGRQLRIKKNDPIFDQYAVHAWFENVRRGEGETEDYIHIYFLPVERGWAWQIPINDSITSMGIVAERDVFREFAGTPDKYFDTYVASNAALQEAMRDAVRINDFKSEGDYSYSMEKFVGNGWLLVGDAARFVDPIFSTGVFLAMKSADIAADAVEARLRNGSMRKLRQYERDMTGALGKYFRFISNFYRREFLEVFLQPSTKFGLLPAIIGVLAGDVFSTRRNRFRLALFFLLVQIQKRRPVIARPIAWDALPAAASV